MTNNQPRHRAPRSFRVQRLVFFAVVLAVALAVTVVGLVSTANAVRPHRLDATPCVTHQEWQDAPFKPVDRQHFSPVAWTRVQVNEYFGQGPFDKFGPSDGFFFGSPATFIYSDYHGCWHIPSGEQAIITVEFAKSADQPVLDDRHRTIDAYAY